ncbi:polysaccharide biosynthesis C-terminal domain-containing protein [Micromonospora schwarzwaldensis]|uniref:polysaccharide biosynthesis C-terminal domain-containing protein n=1 Tax=Micromonospora sp. DSM 45708 TaxID=3111767 RepID=UPI0031CE44B2
MVRRIVSPERLYLAALALTGLAALLSVTLPAAERGELAATMVSATVGAALGGLSVDTFLLSRPAGWIMSRGRWWIVGILAVSLVLTALAAALLTTLAGLGSHPVGMAAGCALTVANTAASLGLRLRRFWFVYALRAAGGAVLVTGYALLWRYHRLDGARWGQLWLGVQVLTATVLGGAVLVWARRSGPVPAATAGRGEYRADLLAVGRLHVGVCAQMLTYRLSQVLVARFAGAGPLGVFALAVAALEFAQSGAVVRAQRILAERDPDAIGDHGREVVRGAAPIAALAVAGLAVLGVLAPDYRQAWLLGLLLLPGTLALSAGKTWSAALLKRADERATTAVALTTMGVSVVLYVLLIPWTGAVGAAVASSVAYAVYAVRTRRRLHRSTPALVTRMA